jgi:hypothetical protein
MSMVNEIEKACERFCEGFLLSEGEQRELEKAILINRENDEAVLGGYSVSSRIYRTPKIPGILERVRRGLGALLNR